MMSLAKLIESGLIAAFVPEFFHDAAIHQIMTAIDNEIQGQLRSTGKVDLPFEDELILEVKIGINGPIGMSN